MKVRALCNCIVPDPQGRPAYRRGPEYDIRNNLIDGGEVFEIPDSYPINEAVLEVVEAPAVAKGAAQPGRKPA